MLLKFYPFFFLFLLTHNRTKLKRKSIIYEVKSVSISKRRIAAPKLQLVAPKCRIATPKLQLVAPKRRIAAPKLQLVAPKRRIIQLTGFVKSENLREANCLLMQQIYKYKSNSAKYYYCFWKVGSGFGQ